MPLTKSKSIYSYNATITAGYNFADITIEEDGNKVNVTLPDVQTISKSVDPASLYYRVVVFRAPLQGLVLHCKGCCGLVCHLLPQDGSRKAPTTVLYSIVNQLDPARRFMWNKVTRVKCPVDPASNKHTGGIHHDLCWN